MPNPPLPPFDISQFSSPLLFEALSNPYATPGEVSRLPQARYLLSYLTELKTQTIVIERDYTDGDYLDDYSTYYVKCFRPYERVCKRLHFFSIPLSKEQFVGIITTNAEDEEDSNFRSGYVGFVVARPLPQAVIGRTVLRTYPPDGGRRQYPCTKTYEPNLFGVELKVESLAYQQQDTTLAACATVALWTCFHKTAELFGTPCPRPAAITQVANQVVHQTRPFPSRGLSIEQICNAIRQMELEAEVVPVAGNVPVVSLMYGYLKMSIPVILVVRVEGRGLHAVTLVGYSVRKESVLKQEVSSGASAIPMRGLRIDKFYAHDDQIGPFSRLMVRPSATVEPTDFPVTFEGSWFNPDTGKVLALYPDTVVIPVYNKIRLTFLDIQAWLARLTTLLPMIVGKDTAIEWDIHLITTNTYKKELRQGFSRTSRRAEENLLWTPLPRFIWRASLSTKGVDIMELLADATDTNQSCPFYHLAVYSDEYRTLLAELLEMPELGNLLIDTLTEPFLTFLNQRLQ